MILSTMCSNLMRLPKSVENWSNCYKCVFVYIRLLTPLVAGRMFISYFLNVSTSVPVVNSYYIMQN